MRVAPGALDVAARERDALWEASVRRDRERKRRAMDTLRLQYHIGQSKRLKRTMMDLIEHHENEAQKLLEGKES